MEKMKGTVVEIIVARQAELGMSDDALASAISYTSGRVIDMIKKGSMRLPANKAVAVADALKLDRKEFFLTVMNDHSPELAHVIQQVFSSSELSDSEANMIRHLRKLSRGRKGAPIVFDGAGVIALVTVQ